MSKKAADDAAAAKKKKAPAAAKAPAKKAAPAAAAAKKPAAKKAAPAKKPGSAASAAPAAGRSKRKTESAQLDLEGTAAEQAAALPEHGRASLESAPEGDPRANSAGGEGAAGALAQPAVELTDEEKELQSVYGEEIAAPATAHAEYRDRQTSDEDRPMLPEITARDERNKRWDDRRDQRRRRRDERDQRRDHRTGTGTGAGGAQVAQGGGTAGSGSSGPSHQGGGGGGGGGRSGGQQPGGQQSGGGGNGQRFDRNEPRGDRGDRPQGDQGRIDANRGLPGGQPVRSLQPPVAMTGHEHDALARVGTPLGDAAATVFAQLRNGQPLPLRQLAQMMRKRNLVEHEPDQLAPQLKAELLGDERSYRALGLRPRIVYRGRDLFAPGPVSMSVTAEAEAELAASLSRLAGATHRALAARIAKATPAGFERLVHAYLVAAGYREIEWVKRTGGIAYAQATAPGIDRPVLISARSGDEVIDRRGIGELRVGVEAKNLVAGVLFSARELSEEAERELERPGRSVAVMCGDHLVASLIAAGVGVVSAAAPMHYVDDALLDELLAG